ncbi:MAG: hypothetical protein Q7U55_08390, partial [Deltaproteobacteria bacterium]|nr:hypothetical protein [Deltaproteobacteria bacterium]
GSCGRALPYEPPGSLLTCRNFYHFSLSIKAFSNEIKKLNQLIEISIKYLYFIKLIYKKYISEKLYLIK